MGKDRREVLLREYEVCQRDIASRESQVWTSSSIFISANVVLLGWIAYAMLSRDVPLLPQYTKCLVLILGVGIISVLFLWKHWLSRMQFVVLIIFERMREIEAQLGMRKNWMIYGLDHWDRLTDDSKKALKELRDRYPCRPWWKFWEKPSRCGGFYARPWGFRALKCVACALMVLWAIIIVLAFIFSGN